MSQEPDSLILRLLREMRADMATKADFSDLRSEIADVRSEVTSLRADVASDFVETRKQIGGVRKDLSDQIVGLRRALVDYHTSVIGHGVIISEMEARRRRVEQHLDLPPIDAH